MKTSTTFKGASKPYGASGHFDEPMRHKLQGMGIKTGHQAWNVYSGGKKIDTVFYDSNIDKEDVKRGLVDHDGYDSNITLKRESFGAPKSNLPAWEGALPEQTLHLILRRLNEGKLKPSDVPFPDDGEGIPLTPEQVEKGRAWLVDQWKTPTGTERKNNPFGYREQAILEKFDTIVLKDFYDASRYGGKPYYLPYYEVLGDNTSFEYYVGGGKINILG